jgi:hypothetical protein
MWRALCFALFIALTTSACKEPYRVGEYVWVQWDKHEYPAYIIKKKGPAKFRVHYDGYDPRWDEDVTLDRIKGRIKGPVTPPPPPEKVARLSGAGPKSSAGPTGVSAFKPGDRVRVRWRGSRYMATVVAFVAPDRYLVHYDGYEAAWDETVSADRMEAAH